MINISRPVKNAFFSFKIELLEAETQSFTFWLRKGFLIAGGMLLYMLPRLKINIFYGSDAVFVFYDNPKHINYWFFVEQKIVKARRICFLNQHWFQ